MTNYGLIIFHASPVRIISQYTRFTMHPMKNKKNKHAHAESSCFKFRVNFGLKIMVPSLDK